MSNKLKNSLVIPIGTNPVNTITRRKKNIIGHMGLIKESQGLDLLFNNLSTFFKLFPNYTIEIIGSGPEEARYKKLSKKYGEKIHFYGFMERPDEIEDIIKWWKAGIATYIPTPWSEHQWGDPSKIKAYLASGTPVITTNVPAFSNEIKKKKAGVVIEYTSEELFKAIKLISKNQTMYSENALKLSQKYFYKKIYSLFLS